MKHVFYAYLVVRTRARITRLECLILHVEFFSRTIYLCKQTHDAMASFYPAKLIGTSDGSQLWIGSARDAADPDFCAQFGLVVNCTKHLPCGSSSPCIRVPIDDDPSENDTLLRALPTACRAISDTLSSGANVLVHCHAGISRSASVTAAALMYVGAGDLDDVVRRIKLAKPETFSVTNAGRPQFWPALKEWERRVLAVRS